MRLGMNERLTLRMVHAPSDERGIENLRVCLSDVLGQPPKNIRRRILQDLKTGHRFLVARTQNEPVGFVRFRIEDRTMIETHFFVREPFRKRGAGHAMAKRMIDEMHALKLREITKNGQQPHEISFMRAIRKKLENDHDVTVQISGPKKTIRIAPIRRRHA